MDLGLTRPSVEKIHTFYFFFFWRLPLSFFLSLKVEKLNFPSYGKLILYLAPAFLLWKNHHWLCIIWDGKLVATFSIFLQKYLVWHRGDSRIVTVCPLVCQSPKPLSPDHLSYQSSCPSTIVPIDHYAFQPTCKSVSFGNS